MPISQRRKTIFYLPDGLRPWDDQYVLQVLEFFAAVYGRKEDALSGTIHAVDLASVLHKRVASLSKGFARRLMIALAFLTPHPLLLMDEPFDGFDLRQTREVMTLLRQAAKDGRTLVLAIHQLADAERICDRLVLLAGERFAAPARSMHYAPKSSGRRRGWRRYSLRSPDVIAPRRSAPFRPLLVKELRGVGGGRALWTMLLILCPIVGFSFFQAISLYGEPSAAVNAARVVAGGLSPLDGVLVPTFGAFYVTVTLLFPFVAIRALGREIETGTVRLLVQLPYRMSTFVAAKMAAVAAAWLVAAIPALSALALWAALGGHLHAPETLNLLLGHSLYGLLIAAIALFAASIAESAATAAIITLAATIGSWVLDFTLAGQPGLLEWISRLSLTQTLRPFEQGLFSVGLVIGILTTVAGFAALAAICLHPGIAFRTKVTRSLLCIAATGAVLTLAAQVRTAVDVTEDRRNSFPAADQRALRELREPLIITVHLAPEARATSTCGVTFCPSLNDTPRCPCSAGHIGPQRHKRREREVLRRSGVHLWRPLGHQPIIEYRSFYRSCMHWRAFQLRHQQQERTTPDIR